MLRNSGLSSRQILGVMIERGTGFPTYYMHSVPIIEKFNGETVWEGIVEVYRVHSQPAHYDAYGWVGTNARGEPDYVTIMNPSITGPLVALRAWLAQEARKKSSTLLHQWQWR